VTILSTVIPYTLNKSPYPLLPPHLTGRREGRKERRKRRRKGGREGGGFSILLSHLLPCTACLHLLLLLALRLCLSCFFL